jgi:hypothetical protein
VVSAELARWAQDEAQRREAAKKQAFSYVMGGWVRFWVSWVGVRCVVKG